MIGDKREAILKFREAVSLKPDYAEAKDNLRKVLENGAAFDSKAKDRLRAN